ncbi:hypothetical protein ABQ397_18060 [Serratia fonticola]|uniref:hypothetical protein n=1 Tax=Serratia fonticola TaxID=47917 RepID=UPI003AAA5D86
MDNYLKYGLVFAVGFCLACLIAVSIISGLKLDIATLKQGHAEYKAAQANKRSDALESLLEQQQRDQERADKLAAELAVTQGELWSVKQQLKARIQDAISNDGATYTGLGPDGLQLYREALGYASDNADVPETRSGSAPRPSPASGPNVR